MYLIIYLLLIFACLIFKQSKLLTVLCILFITYLFYVHISISDYDNYESVYTYIASGHTYSNIGIIFSYICKLFSYFISDFRIFKTIILLISLLLLNKAASTYLNTNLNIFWSLYLIYSSLLDGIQFRFLLAYSILIISFILLCKDNKKLKVFGLLLLLVASGIHSSCYFYILLYFLTIGNKQKYYIPLIVFAIVSLVVVDKSAIVQTISNILSTDRIDRYIINSTGSGIFGILIYVFILFVNYSAISSLNVDKLNSEEKRYINLIKKLNFLMFIVIPLLLFDANFISRFIRPIWIFNIIGILLVNKNEISDLKIFKVKVSPFLFLYTSAIVYNLIFLTLISFDTFVKVII